MSTSSDLPASPPGGLAARWRNVVTSAVDRAFVSVAFRSRAAQRGRGGRADAAARLADLAAFYAGVERSGQLFAEPRPARWSERRVRPATDGQVVDIVWPSEYAPRHPAYAARLVSRRDNAIVPARWYRHARPSAALVCLHGWGGGLPLVEERAFVARWWFRAGLDVVLPALPFHGSRAGWFPRKPIFPSTDPILSNEGFAQAIHDLRALAAALRERGAPAVLLTGMSLGGFTSALAATVDASFDAIVPMIPFASLPRLLWEHGEGTPARAGAQRRGITQQLFEDAFAATTPLRRRLCLDADRVLLVAAERDRVTPLHHAVALREHFAASAGAPVPLVTFAGAHLLQAGRGDALRAMASFFRQRGWMPERRKAVNSR